MSDDIVVLRVEKEKRFYKVYTNKEDYTFSENTIIKFNIFKDRLFSKEELSVIIANEKKEKLLNKCLRFLSYQERTSYEIEEYLKKHEATPEETEAVLANLVALGYVNDEKYADSILQYAMRIRKGPNYIVERLRQKGVADKIVSSVLENYSEDTEEEIIKELISRLIEKNKGLPPLKMKTKLYQKLIYDGFRIELVRTCINTVDFPKPSIDVLGHELKKLLRKYPINDTGAKDKVIKALRNKGYSYAEIQEVLAENEY